jgi:hypothetical protein
LYCILVVSSQQSSDRQVFIDAGPVNADAATDEGVLGAFFRVRFRQPQEPQQRNRNLTAIGQAHKQSRGVGKAHAHS